MVAVQQQPVRWKPPAYSRQNAREKHHLPDITFRWRMGRQAPRGWRAAASDRPHRR
jgi:hypothetical protein